MDGVLPVIVSTVIILFTLLVAFQTFQQIKTLVDKIRLSRSQNNIGKRDYFYLLVNFLYPFLFLFVDSTIKWMKDSSDPGSWVVGTISVAIALLVGNIKPKEFITKNRYKIDSVLWRTERDAFIKADRNIVRWSMLLLLFESCAWILASAAVAKNELPDFWTILVSVTAINLLSLYMGYRKESV